MSTMAEAPAPHAESENSPSNSSDQNAGQSKRPTCILVLGMAGSGKTTFVQVQVIDIVQLLINF